MEIEDVQSSAPPTSPASTPHDMTPIAEAVKSSPRSDDELAQDLRDVTDDSQVPLNDPQADSQVPDESQVPEDSQDTPVAGFRYRSKAPSPHRELRKLQQGKARR